MGNISPRSSTRWNRKPRLQMSKKFRHTKMETRNVAMVVSLCDGMWHIGKASVRYGADAFLLPDGRPNVWCGLRSCRSRGRLNVGSPQPSARKGAWRTDPFQSRYRYSFATKGCGRWVEVGMPSTWANANLNGASKRARQRHSQCSPLARRLDAVGSQSRYIHACGIAATRSCVQLNAKYSNVDCGRKSLFIDVTDLSCGL